MLAMCHEPRALELLICLTFSNNHEVDTIAPYFIDEEIEIQERLCTLRLCSQWRGCSCLYDQLLVPGNPTQCISAALGISSPAPLLLRMEMGHTYHTSGSVQSSLMWTAPGDPSLKWAPPLSDRSDAWLCQICMSTNDNDQIQIIIRYSSSNFKAWHPSPSLVLFWLSAGRKTSCPKPNDTLGKQKTTLSQTLVILKKKPMVSLV